MENKGIGLGTILFIVFLVLKLCGTIDWSWWWVTAPLWIPVALVLFILIVAISCFPKDFENGIRESINKALKKDEDEDE